MQHECKNNIIGTHTGSTRSLTDSSIATKSEDSDAIPIWNEEDLQEFIQAARSIATSPPPTPTGKPHRVLSVIPSLNIQDISSSCPRPSMDTSCPRPSMDTSCPRPSMDTSCPRPSMDTSLPFTSPRPIMISRRPKLNVVPTHVQTNDVGVRRNMDSAYFPEISILRSGLTARSDLSTDDCGSWCCTQPCLHSVFLPVHVDRDEDGKPIKHQVDENRR